MIHWITLYMCLFLSSLIFPQDFSRIFKSDLPEKVFMDKSFIRSVNDNIIYCASIHPSTLYYYFEHLDKFLNHNILKPDSNGSKELKQIREHYSILRNNWAVIQINHIEKQVDNRLKQNAMVNEYEEFLYEREFLDTIELDGDENKIEYFKFKYYKQDSTLNFNPTLDYKKLNETNFKELANSIETKILALSKEREDHYIELINDIKKYWFLGLDYNTSFSENSLIKEPYKSLWTFIVINFLNLKI